MTTLVRYDQARALLRECVTVDEAKDIRDKAEALALYARQRDDTEAAIWLSEIKLRAVKRIGEISRDLEQGHKVGRGEGSIQLPASGKLKEEALAGAGISTSAAQRYEELVGGPTEQGMAAAAAGMEAYFAGARDKQEPPTFKGLKAAIAEAVTDALGPDAPRPKPRKMRPEAAAFADWTQAVKVMAEMECDLDEIADTYPFLIPALIREAASAANRLQQWTHCLEEHANVQARA